MKLFLITVTLSIIIQGTVVRSDPEEDEDNLNDYFEEDENSNSTTIDESNVEGNETLIRAIETAEVTVFQNISEKTTRSGKENYSTLGPNECEKPPFIHNAEITSEEQSRYEVGAKVSYKCAFGYITDGAVPSSHCILSDTTGTPQWTKPELSCVARSCGDPGFVANAQRTGSVFTFPNKVSYECDEGYKLIGYGSRYCHASGRWSGVLPTCERVFCNPPPDPMNGRVIYSSLAFESELRYECEGGYILRNFQGRSCIGNGTWSGVEPVCQDTQCEPPVSPEFGTVQVVGGKSSVGTRAIYTCDAGRILKGSPSSRCLDTGEWTFPTPKCLEPCSVPKVNHGKIGKYVGYRKNRFEEVYVGNKVEEKEEMYLRCENNYEVSGKPTKEEKITCDDGEWSTIPECQPAQCRRSPPPTANAHVSSVNRTHGGGVVYLCKTPFVKVKFGNVICDFGTWKGVTPVCRDSRCSKDDLSFPGLVMGKKRYYHPGETFIPSCESGYYLAKQNNNSLSCENGNWKGHLPPCTPAACHLENIDQEDMASDNEGIVLSGVSAQVKCKTGFSRSGHQARCLKGKWTLTGKLCQESDCNIHKIANGGFTEQVEKKKWKIISYERWVEYEKIGLGRKRSPNTSVYVTCDAGFTFQGKDTNNVPVKCSTGKWNPHPVCLTTGTPYNEKDESTFDGSVIVGRTQFMNVSKDSAIETIRPLSIVFPSQTVSEANLRPAFIVTSTSHPSCFCTYINQDQALAAFAGTESLSYGSRVKDNCTVKFHCHQFGYARLNGPAEIRCKDCQWQPSEFPTCVQSQIGETIFQINGNYKLNPGGVIAIEKGKTISINCYSNGIEDYPKWTAPKGISQVTLTGFADVSCPKLYDPDLLIEYDKEQSFNSSAFFSCKGPHLELVGTRVRTCMSNGQWSGFKPQCKKLCPKIPEVEGMTVSYNKGLSIGSVAAFHCFSPRARSGVPHTTCKQNGEWNDPIPVCTLPNCLVDSLFKIVPEYVVPDMESISSEYVPFNSTISLKCEDGLRLNGPDKAKCGQNGEWEVSKVQCMNGCSQPEKAKDSELIIEPNKDFYRLGELIMLSCPAGQTLSSEEFRLMCLVTGWSQNNLPHCIDG
ncbi:protein lev-9 [Nephila pilipes]|uniref:Protein lev-9 n=1 Tax=Nephila pilipes TaxID=299642 RepID=A0A8X6TQ09_NEPPI|nr:protein lev-9 [Nephila pilipes]